MNPEPPGGERRDRTIAAALCLVVMASRLPFRWQVLYHWDSINFALALEHFDIAAGQPHVPGYILYVGLARAVATVFGDPQRTLVAISVVGSGLAAAALYVLGRDLYDRATGVCAAVFLGTSPLFWFYGVVALPHTLDAFAVTLAVWLLWRVIQGQSEVAIVAAGWLALAGGFRPQTEVFLVPLALYAGWRLSWRQRFTAAAALVFVNLCWAVPLIAAGGGLTRYLQTVHTFYLAFNQTTSIVSGGGWWGLGRNLRKLSMYTAYGVGLAALPLAALAMRRPAAEISSARRQRALVLFLWVMPTAAYYFFIHMGQQGLVFVYLPALLLLSAAGVQRLRARRPAVAHVLFATVIAGNAATFLWAPTYPLGGDRPKLLTVDTLRQHDDSYETRIAAVRQHFGPTHTLLLSSQSRFPRYYLANYHTVPYAIGARWEINEGQAATGTEDVVVPRRLGLTPDATGVVSVVLFDDEIVPFNASTERTEQMPLRDGTQLAYMRLTPADALRLGPQSFGVVAAPEEKPSHASPP